ncbi:MAG: ATP-binding protein [Rhizobiaceae bacterium]
MSILENTVRVKGFQPRTGVLDNLLDANRFRVMFFIALLLSSSIPLLGMTIWIERSAVSKEYAAVIEKHLVVAKNLSLAMSRYVLDVKYGVNLFERMADLRAPMMGDDLLDRSVSDSLESLELAYVAFLDYKDEVQIKFARKSGQTELPDPELLKELRLLAERSKGEIVFSNIERFAGEPFFFVMKSIANGGLILAPMSTDYLRYVQRSVAFGKKGHAMIVDATGRVVAHPNSDWQSQSKDASGVPAVKKMMDRQTGVSVFYAPPLKADVIAGHTFVPETGWGVMVPQPVSELVTHARKVQATGISIAILSFILSMVICWWMSKKFAEPIHALSNVANRIANGDRVATAEFNKPGVPNEVKLLAHSFNKMVRELRLKSEKLTAALEKAESGNQAKSNFLAMISHELRTPINGVIGTLDILEETELNEEQKLFVTTCISSARHLNNIVDDVLTFTQIEAGKTALFHEPTDIREVICEVERLFQPEAHKKGVHLGQTTFRSVPRTLQTDPQRLRQILINLVGNSVKFTNEGEVTITTKFYEDEDKNPWLEFAITDTGIGISKSVSKDLFLPFNQGDNSLARQYGGSGLGLAISKHLVELLGGKIWFESKLGSGTTFFFNLPADSKE